MTKLFLRYLTDNDLIEMLNEKVPILIKQNNIKYHINNYEKNKNNPYKKNLDLVFISLTKQRELSLNVSFLQPIYPFFYCSKRKKILVYKAIDIYEKKLKSSILHH